MTRLSIEIPVELNQVLATIAEKLHEQENDIVVKALKLYLQEAQEDIEDAEIALERWNNPNKKFYTSEEMKQKLEERYRVEHDL